MSSFTIHTMSKESNQIQKSLPRRKTFRRVCVPLFLIEDIDKSPRSALHRHQRTSSRVDPILFQLSFLSQVIIICQFLRLFGWRVGYLQSIVYSRNTNLFHSNWVKPIEWNTLIIPLQYSSSDLIHLFEFHPKSNSYKKMAVNNKLFKFKPPNFIVL